MITGKLFNFPHWGWGSPLDELTRMRKDMNRLLGDIIEYSPQYNVAGVFPLVNIYENTDSFFIRAELPGLNNEDLEITTKGKDLTISGERKIAPKGEDARFHRRERQDGIFSRAITLPTEMDIDKIEARFKNGILTIRAPKAEEAKPKVVKVN